MSDVGWMFKKQKREEGMIIFMTYCLRLVWTERPAVMRSIIMPVNTYAAVELVMHWGSSGVHRHGM